MSDPSSQETGVGRAGKDYVSSLVISPTDPSSSHPATNSFTAGSQLGDEEDLGGDEAESVKVDIHAPIFSLYHECLPKLNALLNIIRHSSATSEVEIELQELRSKLQIWAGNHGAHRHYEDRMSLDHRLREAPELHQEVRDHFKELADALNKAIAIAKNSESDIEYQPEEGSSSSSDSEGSLTNSQKALIGLSITLDPPSSISRLHVASQSIDNIIASLYKFSITIQNPAHKDRTARAAKINVSFWHEHDLRHVQDKFPKCSDAKLLQSLAQANTKRRQLFAYHKRHRDKIQYYQDVNVQEVPTEQPRHLQNNESNLLRLPVASTIRTGKTKLTMTTVSTIKPQIRAIAPSISGRSQRTNITNDPILLGADDALKVPPPPGHSKDFSEPFICPYCFSTIDPTSRKTWEHHVFDDLRPYVCTFADCVSAPVLYERFSEWSTHELEVHRREWFCNFCKILCDTREDFTAHLQHRHRDLVPDNNQSDLLISLCERMSTRDEDCSLCERFTGKPREIQTHLAQHLRQMALHTLPRVTKASGGESDAGTDIAHILDSKAALSDNTQTELLHMSIDECEEYFSALLVPESFRSEPELDEPVNWKDIREPAFLLLSEHDDKKHQQLVESFSRSKGKEDGHMPESLPVAPVVPVTEIHAQLGKYLDVTCSVYESYTLLRSTAAAYKQGFQTLVKWKGFRTDFIGIMDALEIEELLYQRWLEGLIINSSEYNLQTDFFQDKRSLGELNVDELRSLQSIPVFLGSSFLLVIKINEDILEILNSLKTVFLLREDGMILWADQGPKQWDYQMKRMKLSFSKKITGLLASLETQNRSLRELTEATSKLEVLRQHKEIPKIVNSFALTRHLATGLYTVLQNSWNCSCQASHTFWLQLGNSETPETDKVLGADRPSPFRLYITSSQEDGFTRIYNLDVVHQRAVPTDLINIYSMCLELGISRSEGLLGYIGNEAEGHYVLQLTSVQTTLSNSVENTPISLSQLLLSSGEQSFRLTRGQRYNLGSILLKSLLQLSSTPFLENYLKKGSIFFFREGTTIDLVHPYLDFSSIFRKHSSSPSPYEKSIGINHDRLAVRNSLNNVAILLLELLFGESIESQELRKPYLNGDGEPGEYTDYMTARDWVEFADEEDPKLASIIRICVFCSFEEKADWDNKKFVNAVYTTVVQPWEICAEQMTTGKSVMAEQK